MNLLVLNCGSATLKYKLFEAGQGEPDELASGMVEVKGDHAGAIARVLELLPHKPDAVAHRVVHGGDRYGKPVVLTPEIVDRLQELSELAPLHNPPALQAIAASTSLGVPQVAVFDTAFHRTIPEKAYRYALDREIADQYGIRRYGFHGWSHHFVMQKFAEITGKKKPTIITLHLGNGTSAAAICEGRCVDTSMGITPLEGLVMGSRPGDLDVGIVFQLLRKGRSLDEVEEMLWRKSGLIGLAGTNDVRELLTRDDETANLAVDIFCYRARKYIGAYLAVLGGAQAIIFTGGIGENAPEIREKICEGPAGLGIEIDPAANVENRLMISKRTSDIGVYVIPTNEEWMIAKEAIHVLTGI